MTGLPGAGCPIHAVSSHEWAFARQREPLSSLKRSRASLIAHQTLDAS
jgi:hypothetical protein